MQGIHKYLHTETYSFHKHKNRNEKSKIFRAEMEKKRAKFHLFCKSNNYLKVWPKRNKVLGNQIYIP